jgi:hypothetical protein
MKPLIALIGGGGSGKSTIIKTLTGCGRSNYRDFLKDHFTGESILVICGSPQEETIQLSKLRELLESAAADPNCRGVVIAIQPRRTRTRLSMEQIFEEAGNCGDFELSAFIIDPDRKGETAAAHDITSRLSRFPARIGTLDARRFASINAQLIDEVTGLVSGKKAVSAAGGSR